MPSERTKMLDGEPYDPADPELVTGRARARRLARLYDNTTAHDDAIRRAILADLFGTVGGEITVEPPFRCDYGSQIHVGDGFYANFGCVVLDVNTVEFGEDCLLGPGVHVYTATHPLAPEPRRRGIESGEPVTVGDNVWIGGQAVLNPGVTVGDDAVVASGAVVVDDVPSGTFVAGNPAEVVREIDDA